MSQRAALRLVPSAPAPAPSVRFCGYCGADCAEPDLRVCPTCALGVILEADPRLAPTGGDPFLVVDSSLCICAVSEGAEALLGVDEPEAVNRHLAEFLVPAAAEARGAADLMALVASAASGDDPVRTAVVRPAGEFGIRHLARVGAVGPPLAALVVLTDDAV